MLPFSRVYCVPYQDLRDSKGECEGLRSELETLRRRVQEEGTGGDIGSLRAQVHKGPANPSFFVCLAFVACASLAATTVFASFTGCSLPHLAVKVSRSYYSPAVANIPPLLKSALLQNSSISGAGQTKVLQGIDLIWLCLGSLAPTAGGGPGTASGGSEPEMRSSRG